MKQSNPYLTIPLNVMVLNQSARGGVTAAFVISDKDLVVLYCALIGLLSQELEYTDCIIL